ncbi:MAG: spore coat associated protein CotJA [Lachnospiraceae bacterium]|nr:spore coat associated protein CotJA [Lachnospiraceae bacterium]
MRDNHHSDHSGRSVTCVANANFPVGMTYVPMQKWGPLYDHQKALCQGTLFPEMDKPFMGGRALR